jgi:thiol-disulfide isomerase/thioredoxin
MNRFTHPGGAVLLLSLLLAVPGASAPVQQSAPPGKATFRVANYAELGKTIRSFTGKVVVVDFWSTTCVPCIKGFPHLVEMHHKYSKKGFVAVSVSLDPPSNPKKLKRVEEFLEKQKATFTNLVLDAPAEEYQKKLRFDGPPCIYLFDRTNRIVGKWPVTAEEAVDYGAIEKRVIELLKE